MLVKLTNDWFAPSIKVEYAKGLNLSVSGKRFKKGTHEMSDDLFEYLPPGSEVLEKAPEPEPEAVEVDMRELDLGRQDADRHEKLVEEADKTQKSYKKKDK